MATDSTARVRLARQCIALGCDGVLASLSYESEDQYRRDVEALAALCRDIGDVRLVIIDEIHLLHDERGPVQQVYQIGRAHV